ncbi:MAG: hypothetical protein GY835_10260 [bacterium]|nr:hypothetical protein [bacterium]
MVERIYTSYVSSLKADGSPPDTGSFREVCEHLRRDLIREMGKSRLWNAPPAFVGMSGSSWQDGDALDELLHDCYISIFVRRLKGLRNQVKLGRDVAGLVRRNIRQRLSELRRKVDPIGYRVFQLLQSAILRAIEAGELHVLEGDPDIRNATVLGFGPRAGPDDACLELADHVRAWNDELLPELITARGGAVAPIEERLTSLIVGLKTAGIEAFGFKDLIDPMKRDVRQRWHAVWANEVDEVTVVPPPDPAAGADRLGDLHRCVSVSIDELTERKKTKDYLWKLWIFLRGLALDDEYPKGTRTRPPDVKISDDLDIPRGRLPDLFGILGRLVKACLAGVADRVGEATASASRENPGTPAASRRGEQGEQP